MRRVIITIIIITFLALGIWRISTTVRARMRASTAQAELPVAVEVEKVSQGSISEELNLIGNVKADHEVNVFPKIAGRIERIFVEEGARVSKGTVLAKLEDKELLLRVRQAEIALNTAKVAYEQAKALSEVKVRSQVAQAQAGFVSAEAALKQVMDLSEARVVSQLESAEAGLTALKANLKKIKDGARVEERKQIEATVQQAKANMENALADKERIERLYNEGAVSAQTLDAAKTRAEVAKAQYEAASQQLKLVETGARPEDILAMESQVRQAEAGLELIRKTVQTKSWEQDIRMAQARYDQAKAVLDTAVAMERAKSWEAEIAAAEANVKQAETALELSKEALGYATITAPIDGIVSKREFDAGNMANPAMPLFTIVNMNTVKVIVEVPESSLHKVSRNSKIKIYAAGVDEPIEGQISLISPVIKQASRTASMEILIDNSKGLLKPGSFVKVNIVTDFKENTLLVRRSAVLEDKENTEDKYVFVVENDKSFKKKVKTGIANGDMVEVIDGLRSGEKVIVSGQNQVKDGTNVKITNNI